MQEAIATLEHEKRGNRDTIVRLTVKKVRNARHDARIGVTDV